MDKLWHTTLDMGLLRLYTLTIMKTTSGMSGALPNDDNRISSQYYWWRCPPA